MLGIALAVLFGLCVTVGLFGRATVFSAPERDYNDPRV